MLCFLLLPSPPARISYGAAAIMAGIVRVGDHVVKEGRGSIEGLAAGRDEGDAVMRLRDGATCRVCGLVVWQQRAERQQQQVRSGEGERW
jgi:hypothetical protein